MRQRNVPPRCDQHGFTLVEVMVAALVLMVGVLGTFVMIDGANRTTSENNARTSVTAVGREILEQARSLEYTKIVDSTSPADGVIALLRQRPSLTGSVQNGNWVIERRGLILTVAVDVCTFDDPADGVASTPPAQACPAGSGSTTTGDTNPDDFRRVIATLSWRRGGRTNQLVHTAQVVNPSGGLGPRITKFPNPNGGAQIGDHAGPSLGPTQVALNAESTFSATVRWSVDDGRSSGQANATQPGGMLWDWTWNIGTAGSGTPGVDWVVDGSYAVNAQPFDSRGVPGEVRVASVLLNRRRPIQPRGVGGGRSGGGSGSSQLVEIDWVANPERDIIGYRVYRIDLTTVTRVCPPSTQPAAAVTRSLNCTDSAAPSGTADLTYRVVAVDRPVLGDAGSGTYEGDARDITIGPLGPRLDKPTGVTVTTNSGRPSLSWTAPTTTANGTAISPDDIIFYRIYRDGIRYARTVSNATTFVDTTPSLTSHRYAVSAVHKSYNEGKLSDPEVIWP